MKKIFMTILILSFILLFIIPISNANSNNITIDSASGSRGDDIRLTVSTDSLLGFVAAEIVVRYDENKLEYISSNEGKLVSKGLAMINDKNSGVVRLVYAGNAVNETRKHNGNSI